MEIRAKQFHLVVVIKSGTQKKEEIDIIEDIAMMEYIYNCQVALLFMK